LSAIGQNAEKLIAFPIATVEDLPGSPSDIAPLKRKAAQ